MRSKDVGWGTLFRNESKWREQWVALLKEVRSFTLARWLCVADDAHNRQNQDEGIK